MKKNNKGFTLAELLIVVAIIAVLTVVAVPIFTTQLEKSREETDIANMREAKAAAAAAYLNEETFTGTKGTVKLVESGAVYFDASAGKLVADAPKIGYGKGTSADGGAEEMYGYKKNGEYKDKVIKVGVYADGTIEMWWEAKGQ